MNIIEKSPIPDITTPDSILSLKGNSVTLCGCVYKIRRASGIVFVNLSYDRYIYQGVYIPDLCENSLNEICEGAYIELTADVKEEKRSEYGFELTMRKFKVLSIPVAEYPICITQPSLMCNLTENLNNRTVALRHPKEIAVMSIVSGVKRAITDAMDNLGFNPVTTPKISTIKDSTTDYISVKYFGEPCNLALSPQYYKQMALCAFSRVYEITTCYSDINRNSTRHLNEYTCLEFEMAYNSGIDDSMRVITNVLSNCANYIKCKYSNEINMLDCTIPEIAAIPAVTYDETLEILKKNNTSDIDPTDEAKLTLYANEKHGCEFIFVTHLPSLKQPFYARERKNFILIYKGVTIASGSENINDYKELINSISEKSLCADDYKTFIDTFKYGMPPHGGGKVEIERFVTKLLNLENIRDAVLFPRDLHHLTT